MPPSDISSHTSPVKKKPRLSSPEGPAQGSSQEHADALDVSLIQPMLGFAKATAFDIASNSSISDDPENPFTNPIPPFAKASAIQPGFGFASASSIKINITESRQRSRSPEAPPEQDYDAWFEPSTETPLTGFQIPSFASALSAAPQPAGFVGLRSRAAFAPSTVALAKAQAQMRNIWDENLSDDENVDKSNKSEDTFTTPVPINVQFRRPALQSLDNGFQTPVTPIPAGFSRPSILEKPSTIEQLGMKQKPFRSPLIKSAPVSTFVSSPLKPKGGFSSAVGVPFQRPTTSNIPSTPLRPTLLNSRFSNSHQTPLRVPPSIPRSNPAPFVTPFKPGMRPGEPGWAKLQDSIRKGGPQNNGQTPVPSNSLNTPRHSVSHHRESLFDLRPPRNRKTLATSGLHPQSFTQEDFESMDINIEELQQIMPALAVYYSFHTASMLPLSEKEPPSQLLGPTAALKELQEQGCTLVTKAWVDNHWSLILWKLAGMVALDPDSESDEKTKRWCWPEVKRQLLYRYERELDQAKRPALRLISTQDSPASFPLALCISNILWLESEDRRGVTYPVLEVTDGWYRLRAKVDAPMARAIKRGIICVGRKIGVAGARLDSERKEPQEILDAYNSVKLVLSGNSSHLLSWYTKLGFMKGPCISTLHSLTPDGGSIAAMDIVVVKAHALAFIEFFDDPNGQKKREGPRGEAEEMKVNEDWKKKRDREASKLRTDFEKKISRYESYIDKLERRAGNHFHPPPDDEPPDHIDKLHDQLEVHEDAVELLGRIASQDAGWLARHTRRCLELERERAGEDISRELEEICPPRDVRSFRVVTVEDSQTCRRPANRHAQLTIWDVLSLTLSEGAKPGTIKIGSRFLITNLIPQQQGAWMGRIKPNSQIFLATTRATRWRKLKATT